MMKNDSNLFFTCSLVEYIGRKQKLERSEVVSYLKVDTLKRIYKYSDVLHCEPIAKVADEFIQLCNIPEGHYDNVAKCKYTVPDYWTIGDVYSRLIEDMTDGDVITTLIEIYSSWIDKALSNYNTDLFYQTREYLSLCYREEEVVLV